MSLGSLLEAAAAPGGAACSGTGGERAPPSTNGAGVAVHPGCAPLFLPGSSVGPKPRVCGGAQLCAPTVLAASLPSRAAATSSCSCVAPGGDIEGGGAGEAAVPYGALYDALGRTLHNERAVLLLYALLHGSSSFHEYCLVREGLSGTDPPCSGLPASVLWVLHRTRRHGDDHLPPWFDPRPPACGAHCHQLPSPSTSSPCPRAVPCCATPHGPSWGRPAPALHLRSHRGTGVRG